MWWWWWWGAMAEGRRWQGAMAMVMAMAMAEAECHGGSDVAHDLRKHVTPNLEKKAKSTGF
jgi:hypothetical protein